jgi:hypothetical protein
MPVLPVDFADGDPQHPEAHNATNAVVNDLAPFTIGGVILNPTGARDVVVWTAPYACTVTSVRGYRRGGSAASVNARRNASQLLAADLSIPTEDTWAVNSSPQNADVAEGDTIEIQLVSVTGSVTDIAVQLGLTRV